MYQKTYESVYFNIVTAIWGDLYVFFVVIVYFFFCFEFFSQLNLLARNTVTKHHKLRDLDNRRFFSHNSGGQKPNIKASAELVSSEASFLSLCLAVFSLLSSHGLPSVCRFPLFKRHQSYWIRTHQNDLILI